MVSRESVTTGIGDDMAVIDWGGRELLITTDMLLEGVHFDLAKASLEEVGYKVMACSLSDCAAMAAEPFAAVAAVALPKNMALADAKRLVEGMQQAAVRYNCPLIGGDTTSWDKPLAIDVTMLACMADGHRPVLRSGAKVGDAIMVTGQLGGSLAGRHLSFEPRVAEARLLAERVDLHAMIDISDGLAADLGHICERSGVGAVLEAINIPISPAAAGDNPLAAALGDGEDFELLFCVSEADAKKLLKFWSGESPVPLTRIGEITAGEPGVKIRNCQGAVKDVEIKGWEHFRE